MPSIELIQAIMVTSELCGRTFSEAAATVFVSDLATYPQAQVLKALVRCRREVRGALTLQDVISRMEDGRPGVEEAWSMLPHSEGDSAVWTTEMSQAFGVCVGLIDSGDMVAARMAFKETYLFQVCQARDAGKPVEWHVTLGHDIRGRESALIAAVDKGRISYEKAQEFIPALPMKDGRAVALIERVAESLRIAA
jgi:hypothetical protein